MYPFRISDYFLQQSVSTLNQRSVYTFDHMCRLHDKAKLLYPVLNGLMDGITIDEFVTGAFFHDIGKAHIKPYLNNAKPLKQDDLKDIEQHPYIGYYMLVPQFGEYSPISLAAKEHHERYDGSGYPYHLQGESIQPMSYLIQWLDKFDAITHKRPYQERIIGGEEAFNLLDSMRGENFPDSVCDAMYQLNRDGFFETLC